MCNMYTFQIYSSCTLPIVVISHLKNSPSLLSALFMNWYLSSKTLWYSFIYKTTSYSWFILGLLYYPSWAPKFYLAVYTLKIGLKQFDPIGPPLIALIWLSENNHNLQFKISQREALLTKCFSTYPWDQLEYESHQIQPDLLPISSAKEDFCSLFLSTSELLSAMSTGNKNTKALNQELPG